MKVLCVLALFALAVSALPVDDRVSGENGWYVPQEDGSFVWMDIEEGERLVADMEQMEARLSTVPVSFYLYTQRNPTKGEKIQDTTKSVDASYYNPDNPTRFVIHGWTQSYKSIMNKQVRDAWLYHGDYNVIVVDWGRARGEYALAVAAVSKVGKKLAYMIDFLVRNYKLDLDDLEVAGHSLGAHVAGYAGKLIKTGQIHTIVGLDPALPLFSYNKPKKRLALTDAFYVESIQTDAGLLGFLKPIGKGAFYPNGGKNQPGCGWDLTGACDHERSVAYYAEAIEKNNFPTVKCKDYNQAVSKTCGATYSPVRMGAMSNAMMVSGDYFVPVNGKAPYGMGN